MSIKAFVEKADAFVQVVQVINEHPISYHSLLSNTTLQFIPLPASKPHGALDQFFGVLFKISQDPDIVVYPEHRPLLVPTINHFRGREGDPYMEQSGNTHSYFLGLPSTEGDEGPEPGAQSFLSPCPTAVLRYSCFYSPDSTGEEI